jgi:tetratricopeptide (TPR) repeat protein
MSEHIGDTQPIKAVRKVRHWRSIVLSVIGVIVLIVLGGLGGYGSGIAERQAAETSGLMQEMTAQYQYALVDEQFGRFADAKERLDYIIEHNPSFPGAQNELAKVLVQMTIPTPTPTPPPTATPDLRGEQSLFATAQQLIATKDWANALTELGQLRKQDPTFNTSQVDGMYYFALRNYGVYLIQQGNLEGGIYQLTLAERFAPLDNTANQLRESARAYLQASSYYGVDWRQSAQYFKQVDASLWDGTMSAGQRYQFSLMRYGDDLFKQGQACDAYQQYQDAQAISALDTQAARNQKQAFQQCYPATPTEVPATELPAAPTDTAPAPTP